MSSHGRIGAIVLAAGQSRRMGTPKTLLDVAGEPMLQRVLGNLRCADSIFPIVVVTGHEPQLLRSILSAAEIIEVHNPDHAAGEMISSIQIGAAEMRGLVEAVFIVLADQPMIQPHTLNIMSSTWRARRPQVLLPTFNEKHGHPILINASAIGEIMQLPRSATLKTFTSRHAAATLDLEVNDPAILEDIDTPEQYQRTLQQQHEDVPCKSVIPV